MSAVGKRMWLHMQEKGPYNQRAFARMLDQRGHLKTTHQSISAWLHKDHPAPYFVNALVKGLGLTEEEERDLHFRYFYGEPKATPENLRAAQEIEAEEESSEQDVSKGQAASPRR